MQQHAAVFPSGTDTIMSNVTHHYASNCVLTQLQLDLKTSCKFDPVFPFVCHQDLLASKALSSLWQLCLLVVLLQWAKAKPLQSEKVELCETA